MITFWRVWVSLAVVVVGFAVYDALDKLERLSNRMEALEQAPTLQGARVETDENAEVAALCRGCRAVWAREYSWQEDWGLHFNCPVTDELVEMVARVSGIAYAGPSFGDRYMVRVRIGKQFELDGVRERVAQLFQEGK